MTVIHIVYGAPCSGKTTFVENNIKSNDIKWDWDLVEYAFSGKGYQEKNLNLKRLIQKIRKVFVDECITNRCIDNVWIIATDLNQKLIDELSVVGEVICHEMDATIDVCKERLQASKRTDKEELLAVIDDWYAKHDEWW